MQDLHNARTVIDGLRSSLPFLLQHSQHSAEDEVQHLWPETVIVDALTMADVPLEDDEVDIQSPSVPYEELFPDDRDFRVAASRTDRPPSSPEEIRAMATDANRRAYLSRNGGREGRNDDTESREGDDVGDPTKKATEDGDGTDLPADVHARADCASAAMW